MLPGLEEESSDADDQHGTEERTQRIYLLQHKGLVRGDGPRTEAVGLTVDEANSMKCILDALEGHYKPRSNEIVAAPAYKQLVQGNLGLPEYTEKCKELTAACKFNTASGKCL